MEFDVNRVYTSLNADLLKYRKCLVILADDLASLKHDVKNKENIVELAGVRDESYSNRFVDSISFHHWNLAYLIQPND